MKMRKKILAAFLLCIGCLMVAAASSTLMSVQVKTAEVRSSPSFLGKIVRRLTYTDPVQVVGENGAWRSVLLAGEPGRGWMHESALSSKRIVWKAGDTEARQAASGDEIALAGKGFNRQVEGEFKDRNPNIDYTWIDRMEQIVVSQEEMVEFLKEGNLTPSGGKS